MLEKSLLKATDPLEAWLSYLEQSHFKPIDLGLDRIQTVARGLDLLKPLPYVITVAGTNGKGSTCRFLETALIKAGYRVGVYSSPHLLHYRERVRIMARYLPDEAHTASFAHIDAHKTASLTYFEFSTLSALHLFQQANLDIVILEVGLGGRLDATNIVDADMAIVTAIDIDHESFLGNNREDIGREKAGIFRANQTAIIGDPDCPKSVFEVANALGNRLVTRDHDWHFSQDETGFHWRNAEHNWQALPVPQIPPANAATAIAALTALPFAISEAVIREALNETRITGRFQRLNETDFAHFNGVKPRAQVIIDVGHNPHAARYLSEKLRALKAENPLRRIWAVFSALEDKDLAGIVTPLEGVIDVWCCAGLDCPRGQSGENVVARLTASLPNAQAKNDETVANALNDTFTNATENDIVLIFGSFYTVAEAVELLQIAIN